MANSIVALLMLVCMVISNDPTYAVAAGLFEIAAVMHSITRPRRLTPPNKEEPTNG